MRIAHFAVYVNDLEAAKAFYEVYFGAKAGGMYHNEITGLKTYFMTFDCGGKLELMTRPDLEPVSAAQPSGYSHIAVSAGGRENVDRLTERLRSDGFSVISGPRVTGDGYYESCVLDLENNRIEITE